MKKYDFDTPIERRGTGCVKYDMLGDLYGRTDLLPMWVADMDFRSPDFVVDALKKRLDHDVLGYAMAERSYYDAVLSWLGKRYGVDAQRSDVHFIPGIVAGIAYTLLAFTEPGDKVLVTTPVYPPFLHLPADNGRVLECSPLLLRDGRFEIDFDDFERRARECKLCIMSNPHNPAGTVWSKDDLQRVSAICKKHGVLVVSDEIHADLVLPGHRHTSFSTVGSDALDNSITFIAPSKTFNIAGLGSSVCYIGNESIRKRFFGWLDGLGVAGGNIFAFIGAAAAYSEGEEWLAQMVDYLAGNVDFLRRVVAERLPKAKAVLPESSYLAWLDFGGYGLTHKELAALFVNEARVALNDGTSFGGDAFQGWFRMNIGCPRSMVGECVNRIADALARTC